MPKTRPHHHHASDDEIRGWFTGRLPDDWFTGPVDVSIDRDEIIVTGTIAAPEARRWGLVDHIVPVSELRRRALEIAESLA